MSMYVGDDDIIMSIGPGIPGRRNFASIQTNVRTDVDGLAPATSAPLQWGEVALALAGVSLFLALLIYLVRVAGRWLYKRSRNDVHSRSEVVSPAVSLPIHSDLSNQSNSALIDLPPSYQESVTNFATDRVRVTTNRKGDPTRYSLQSAPGTPEAKVSAIHHICREGKKSKQRAKQTKTKDVEVEDIVLGDAGGCRSDDTGTLPGKTETFV